MRQFLLRLTLLCFVIALLPAAVALPAAAQSEVVADQELVIINSDDRIVVRDPYTPPGYAPLTWESPQTGYRQVATGDFNSDGTDEIVGLRGGEAQVFDPYRQPNEPDVARVFTASPGQVWSLVATGKYYLNRGDCIVLQQGSPGTAGRLYAYCYIPPTGWSQVYAQDLGAGFLSFASGDVDANQDDELIGIRNSGSVHQIIIFNPSNNWIPMYEANYDYPWVAVASGNIVNDVPPKDEIATTRSGVSTNLNSFLVFRWLGNNNFEDIAGEKFFPEFRDIAVGDVVGNGDDEVYLLRPGVYNGAPIVALTSRNYGNDYAIVFNELAGQTRFGNVEAGDIEGDGKAEVVVMAFNEYIIYTEPATSTAFQSYPGNYSTSLSFALGNLDGSGISQGPSLAVSPTTVTLSLQSGQTGTQAVQITNSGTGTLTWTSTVTQGATWLSIQPTGGTAPTAATLQIDARNLTAGSYTGTVRISGQSGSSNSPQNVTVNLTVTAPPSPRLSITPTAISLSLESGQSTTRPVQITNTGAGTLAWTASLVEGAPWLSFSPSNGTAPSTLTLTINAVNVQPGQYSGTVRVTAGAGVLNSPQDVTVSLTVTAPPFFVTPTAVTWTYIPPTPPGTRTVTVTGTGISWHAGVVPMDSMQRIQAAIDAGRLLVINGGILALGDGGEDVPIVDYVDVSPSSSTANQTGVTLSLIPANVPYGLNQVAVVFVADGVASPPAVVVRASVLRTLPGASDLYFVPLIVAGQ